MVIERVFQFLFWSALVTALLFAILPQAPVLAGGMSDKVQHFWAFFVLGGLLGFAYPRRPIWFLLLSLVLFGGCIEVLQAVSNVGRQAEWFDLAADIAGCSIALLAIGSWRRLSS